MSEMTDLLQKIQDIEMDVMCLKERVVYLENEVEVLIEKPDPFRELTPVCGFEVPDEAEEFDEGESEY